MPRGESLLLREVWSALVRRPRQRLLGCHGVMGVLTGASGDRRTPPKRRKSDLSSGS